MLYLDNSVSFFFLWFRKDDVSFLYRSISFFLASCQSYVRFSRGVACNSRLICNVFCKALSFEGALFFLSAVAFFDVFRGWG